MKAFIPSLCALLIAGAAGCDRGGGGGETPPVPLSFLSLASATATANGTSAVSATVTVTNSGGGPLSGVPVTFAATGTGNSWDPATATTGADGTATASLSSTRAEQKTLSAGVAGVASGQTQVATFEAGPPSSSTSSLTVFPGSLLAGTSASATVTAAVNDARGNPVPGATVTFDASGSSNAWAAPSAVTSQDGRASVTLRSTSPEAKSVRAAVGNVTIGTAQPVTFLAGSAEDQYVGGNVILHSGNYASYAGGVFPVTGLIADETAASAGAQNWTAFRAAVDSAVAGGGGRVHFPRGHYYFTAGDQGVVLSAPLIDTTWLAHGIYITGEGKATHLRPIGNGTDTHFVDVRGMINVELSRLMLSQWRSLIHTTTPASGRWIDGSIQDCWISSAAGYEGGGVVHVKTTSALISHNVIDVSYGNAIHLLPGSSYVQIRNNLFYDIENPTSPTGYAWVKLAGLDFDDALNAVQFVDISGNAFYESALGGGGTTPHKLKVVEADGCRNITFSNNQIERLDGSGLVFGGAAACKNVVVSGNTSGVEAPSSSLSTHGSFLRATGGTFFDVSGNMIQNPGEDGIHLDRVVSAGVTNNTIDTGGAHGIHVTGGLSNRIIGNTSTNNVRSGIAIVASHAVVVASNVTMNNDSTGAGGISSTDYAGIYIQDTVGGVVSGNSSRNSSGGAGLQHFNIQVAGATRDVQVFGNQLEPYRTRPIDWNGAASAIISQESNFWGTQPGVTTSEQPAGTYAMDALLDKPTLVFSAAITSPGLAVTLPTTSTYAGMKYRIIRARTATGAYDVNVGSGPLKALTAADQWCDVQYSGVAWVLTGYGTL